ncbi:hypothetical protein FOA43_002828 [Brettanomyces nanus]|uniref:Glucose-6-phosphate 1-epimerase n=1 Tax=Eeniella nana TaxID=13502 RepID=A0A875S3K3_EENNA|nr:uncharacterized protein FOA43_002828 [Brettanomyces nanus]QPG75473.1 hypothetical protein FOA43_002828 [Brettanomyces nanus]
MPITNNDDEVIITSPSNGKTQLKVLKYGATVYSWTVNGKEQLWLSDAAKLDGSKPVRGGIPLVFPVFGKSTDASVSKMPQHGFARRSTWEFLGQTTENPPAVQFGLGPELADQEVYSKWDNGDNDFTLVLTLTLENDSIRTRIDISNPDKKPWKFNWLFHSYLKVDDIEDVLVNNLPGEICYDQVIEESYEEREPAVNFAGELDRIYQNVSTKKLLQVIEMGKVVHNVRRKNLPDVVIWNPWTDKSKGMADFEPKNGYLKMICVEPGYVHDFVTLKPGEKWSGEQIIYKGDAVKMQSV